MPKSIDQRVVEMQFDNSNFEKNVSQSMSTLDKLKEKLNFKGVSDSMNELNSSMSGLNINPIASALSTVGDKFSWLEQIGIGVLRKIGEQAVTTGEQFIKSLTIDNVSAGWQKFAEKTNAVSTLAAQGYELETINEQMDLLNWYTDETSYNFVDMANNIGKFTASGQSLNDSVDAMMGIANWAALSGQGAAKASSAMYQLSQAMSKGALKYDDWRSIQNASMDTIEFREIAASTAVTLGSMAKVGDDAYKLVYEAADGTKEFSNEVYTLNDLFTSDLLTRKEWLDTDVMMETFNTYGRASKTLKSLIDDEWEGAGTASEAMDALEKKARAVADAMLASGADITDDEAMNAALKQVSIESVSSLELVKDEAYQYIDSIEETTGVTISFEQAIEELGYGIDSMSLKAFRAAQEARSWQDVMDSVKDAVSTGWMNTFEYIFGDMEEAKTLWTDLANELYDVFAEGGNVRNDLLKSWKEMGGRNLLFANTDEETGAFWNLFYGLKDVLDAIKDAFNDIFPPMTVERLVDLTQKFKDFTEKIRPSEVQLSRIRTVFRGLFSAIDLVGRTIGAVLKGFSPLIPVIKQLGDFVIKLIARFGNWVKTTNDTAQNMGRFEEITQNVSNVVQKIVDVIYKFIDVIKSLSEAFAHLFTANTDNVDGFGNKVEERFSKLSTIAQKIIDRFGAIGEVFSKVYEKLKPIFEAIGTAASNAIDNVIGAFSGSVDNLDVNGIVQLIETGLGAASILGIKKIIDTIKDSVNKLFGLKDIFEPIANAFEQLEGTLKAYQNNLNSDVLMKIAKAIAILAASLLILSLIDADKLSDAISAITVLFGELMGSFAILSKTTKNSKSLNMVAIGAAFEEIAIAMLILAAAMKVVSTLSWEEIIKSLVAFAGAVKILPEALNGVQNAKGAFSKALAMILLSTALVILAAAMKSIASLSWEGIAKALAAMAVALYILPQALNTIKFGGAFTKALSMILLTASLKILASAMHDLAALSWEGIGKALASLAVTLYILPQALNSIKFGKAFGNALSMILLTASLKILASAMKDIAELSWEGIGKALASLAIALYILPEALNKMKFGGAFTKALSMILLMTSMNILASAMSDIAQLSWDGVAKGLGTMIAAMMLMVYALKSMNGNQANAYALVVVSFTFLAISSFMKQISELSWEGIGKALASMFVTLGTMVLALNLLSEDGALKKAAALFVAAIALTAIALSLKVLSSIGWAGLLVGIVGLVAVLGLLWVAAKVLAPATADILALSASIAVFSLSMAAFGIGMISIGAGIIAIGTGLTIIGSSMPIIAAGLSALIPVLFDELPLLFITVAESIRQSAPYFGEAIIEVIKMVLNVIETTVPDIIATLLRTIFKVLDSLVDNLPNILSRVFELVGAVLGALIEAIPTYGHQLFEILIMLLNLLVEYMPQLVDALVNLVTSLLISLASKVPDLLDSVVIFISALFEGVITAIGELVGNFIGSIINGVGTVIADGLPHIGEKLSEFSESLQPFLDMTSGISEDSMRGVKLLAETILLITAAEFINGLSELLSFFGGSSSSSFGDTIVNFGDSMAQFADKTKDIDSSKVEGSARAAKALAEFANNLPKEGGLWQEFFGTGNLTKFGEELETFAPHFVAFANTVAGIENTDAVVASAEAAKALADFAGNLPPHGGEWQKWFGDASLTTFAKELDDFAPSLVSYAQTVNGINSDDVQKSIDAATILADFATKLPPHDGVWQDWTGDASLTTFAKELDSFAPSLVSYANTVKNLDGGVIQKSADAAAALSALETGLSDSGGVVAFFAGDNTLKGFGQSLEAFGQSFVSYYTSVKDINTDNIVTVTDATKNLVDICTTMSGIDIETPERFGEVLERLGYALIDGFATSFEASKQDLNEAINSVIDDVYDQFEVARPFFLRYGEYFMQEFIDGIANKNSFVINVAKNVSNNAKNQFDGKYDDFKAIGEDMINGFLVGFGGKTSEIRLKASDMAQIAIDSMRTTLDINSPSKVMEEIGEYTGRGFATGLSSVIPETEEASESLANSMTSSMQEALDKASEAFEAAANTEPTIKPVLDLSDIDSGMVELNGMLGADRSLSLAGTINRSMSGDMTVQNELKVDNSDVVSAIGSLQTDINALGEKVGKMQVFLDTNVLVGELTEPMNKSLGTRYSRNRREG